MTDATKPRIEEICQRRGRIHGPWRQGAVERFHVFTPDGATMAHERVLLRMNEHFAYEAEADFIANAPTDIAWLLERDAAREKRLAELEAELAGIRERAREEIACHRRMRAQYEQEIETSEEPAEREALQALFDQEDYSIWLVQYVVDGNSVAPTCMCEPLELPTGRVLKRACPVHRSEPAAREGEGDAG